MIPGPSPLGMFVRDSCLDSILGNTLDVVRWVSSGPGIGNRVIHSWDTLLAWLRLCRLVSIANFFFFFGICLAVVNIRGPVDNDFDLDLGYFGFSIHLLGRR